MTIELRAIAAAALLAFALCVPARAAGDPSAAERETLAGVCAYSKGDYATARRHFERAAELEPTATGPLVLAARVAYLEVDDATADARPEKARVALAAYERVLARDPNAEEAVTGIVSLYVKTGDTAKALEVLGARAARDGVAPKRKAELLAAAAMIEWRAAYDAMKANDAPGARLPRYKRPPAETAAALHAHLDAARKLVDQALALAPTYNALLYKKQILESVASLAELERDTAGLAAAKRDQSEAAQAFYRVETVEDPEIQASWQAETERAAADAAAFAKTGTLRYGYDPYETIPAVPLVSLMPPPPPPPGASPRPSYTTRPEELEAERRAAKPWKEYTASDDFAVTMPSPVEAGPASADGTRVFASVSEGVSFEIVAVTRHGDGAGDEFALGAAGELAQGICDLARHEPATCEVTLARKLTANGHPSSQYRVSIATPCGETRSGVIRVVVVGNRAYVLDVLGAGEDDPRAQRFLDSFTVGPHHR